MNPKKQKKGTKINTPVLKPVLFAVTKSSMPITQRPIGECLLVTDNSMVDLIGVVGSRFGTDKEGSAIIHRKNVLFYTHEDVSSAVIALNNLVGEAYKEQMANAQAILNAFQKVHEAKI